MDFPYPVRDQDCSTGACYNNSGLNIPTTGCQVLDGAQALSLSRSRYFQYYADGEWQSDPSSDIGRIERQNLIIEAALDKAKSTYNPLRLNTPADLGGPRLQQGQRPDRRRPVLAGRAVPRLLRVRPAVLHAADRPAATSSTAGDVEVVQPDGPPPMITQFLGGPFGAISTPPLDAYGNPLDPAPRRRRPAHAASPGLTDRADAGGAPDDHRLRPRPC